MSLRGASHGTDTGSGACKPPRGEKRKNTVPSSGIRSRGIRTRLRVYTSVSRRPNSRPSPSYASTSPAKGRSAVSNKNVADIEPGKRRQRQQRRPQLRGAFPRHVHPRYAHRHARRPLSRNRLGHSVRTYILTRLGHHIEKRRIPFLPHRSKRFRLPPVADKAPSRRA